MAAVHESLFKIRLYECDAYGHVNHAHYLRFMQEAAVEASAAVGYDFDRYEAMGNFWLVVHTGITYFLPLHYGDTVVVRTWVSDFRRATSRRRYELRSLANGELVAEAYSDWIYLDRTTLRPQRIPPQMIDAFSAGDLMQIVEDRQPFPAFPPPPPGVFRMRRRARWSEIDSAGHVNNAAYLSFFEDAAMELMATLGWTAARLAAEGIAIIAREYRIAYEAPALLDDELEVTTWVSEVKRATARRFYTITRVTDQQPLVRAAALWVWVDLQSGRPIRIPADFLAAFASNVSAK